MKYLGIIIDRKLKWDHHVDYTESDIARKIGLMYRSCKYVSKWHKLTIYRSIILSYIIVLQFYLHSKGEVANTT